MSFRLLMSWGQFSFVFMSVKFSFFSRNSLNIIELEQNISGVNRLMYFDETVPILIQLFIRDLGRTNQVWHHTTKVTLKLYSNLRVCSNNWDWSITTGRSRTGANLVGGQHLFHKICMSKRKNWYPLGRCAPGALPPLDPPLMTIIQVRLSP